MHDYRGCIYPEGLLKNNIISFNHNDIIEIIFKGYINDDYSKLENMTDIPCYKKEPNKCLEYNETDIVGVNDTSLI